MRRQMRTGYIIPVYIRLIAIQGSAALLRSFIEKMGNAENGGHVFALAPLSANGKRRRRTPACTID